MTLSDMAREKAEMARSLQAQHGKMVSNVLKAGANYATQPVAGGYAAPSYGGGVGYAGVGSGVGSGAETRS